MDKLDDGLWVYCIAFKTLIGTMQFRLIYSKPCHLPVELEHKAYWAIKFLKFDLKATGEKMMLQLNELNELHSNACESSRIYKEHIKMWHDKLIRRRELRVNALVLLLNSRLKLFLVKLRSRWSGPFEVKRVHPYGAIEVGLEAMGIFKVNGLRLKHYLAGEPIVGNVSYYLPMLLLRIVHGQAHNLKRVLFERHPRPAYQFLTQIRWRC